MRLVNGKTAWIGPESRTKKMVATIVTKGMCRMEFLKTVARNAPWIGVQNVTVPARFVAMSRVTFVIRREEFKKGFAPSGANRLGL